MSMWGRGEGMRNKSNVSVFQFQHPVILWGHSTTDFVVLHLCEQEVFHKLSFSLLQLKRVPNSTSFFQSRILNAFFEPATTGNISSCLLAKIRVLLLWSFIWEVCPLEGVASLCSFSPMPNFYPSAFVMLHQVTVAHNGLLHFWIPIVI